MKKPPKAGTVSRFGGLAKSLVVQACGIRASVTGTMPMLPWLPLNKPA